MRRSIAEVAQAPAIPPRVRGRASGGLALIYGARRLRREFGAAGRLCSTAMQEPSYRHGPCTPRSRTRGGSEVTNETWIRTPGGHRWDTRHRELRADMGGHAQGRAAPVRERMTQSAEKGVVFAACENTMKRRGVSKEALVSFAHTVDSGVAEVVRKQEAGWSYVRAGS